MHFDLDTQGEPVADRKILLKIIAASAAVTALILLVIGLTLAYFMGWGKLSVDEPAHIVEAVGKRMDLPTNEVPQVIPLTDPRALKEPFFANAKAGDVFIFYPDNHLAILFDPASRKIVNMSRVTVFKPE